MNPIELKKKNRPTLVLEKKTVDLAPKKTLVLEKKSAPAEALKKALKK